MHATPSSLGGTSASVGDAAGGAIIGEEAAAPDGGRTPAFATRAARLAAWKAACPWLAPGGALEADAAAAARSSGGGGGGAPSSSAPRAPPSPPPDPRVPFSLGFVASRSPHVLVCAPSNSALDEIVLRLLHDGLLDSGGATYTPSLVRVGVRPHASVKAVTMDSLVDEARCYHFFIIFITFWHAHISTISLPFRSPQRIASMHRSARAASLAPVAGDASGARSRSGGASLTSAPFSRPLAATTTADGGGGGGNGGGSGGAGGAAANAVERDRARLAILDDAALVASTLSFSGSGLFTRMSRSFDVVVIDEAAQAVEPSTLVPLAYGCRQLFLVGDPIQLPATVLSDAAKAAGYESSLFSRLQKAGYPVHVLKTQYRMHPEIRAFPSSQFYEEALEDGPDVAEKTKREWHAHAALGPFTFWDVAGREEIPPGSGSYCNPQEAALVVALAKAFLAAHPGLGARHDGVAVVTPYRAQAALCRRLLETALGADIASRVDVNTIDGFQARNTSLFPNLHTLALLPISFYPNPALHGTDARRCAFPPRPFYQGREREVVIFSVVRAPLGSSDPAPPEEEAADGRRRRRRRRPTIGFVADERRMNVGLTRARASLAVVGSAAALKSDPTWGSLVQDAVARGRFAQPQPSKDGSYDAALVAVGELSPAEPLQPPKEEEEEEEWAPAPERRAARGEGGGGGDDDELSGDDGDAAAAHAAAQRHAAAKPRGGRGRGWGGKRGRGAGGGGGGGKRGRRF